jgi:hypothetical protein
MKNLKDQLAGIAALVAAVVAIGGGFATYGKLTEKINVLESKSSADYSAQIAVLEEKVAAIESHEHNMAEHGHTKIFLLQVQIEEIKVSTSNPLAN